MSFWIWKMLSIRKGLYGGNPIRGTPQKKCKWKVIIKLLIKRIVQVTKAIIIESELLRTIYKMYLY